MNVYIEVCEPPISVSPMVNMAPREKKRHPLCVDVLLVNNGLIVLFILWQFPNFLLVGGVFFEKEIGQDVHIPMPNVGLVI
mgnify:FL=1